MIEYMRIEAPLERCPDPNHKQKGLVSDMADTNPATDIPNIKRHGLFLDLTGHKYGRLSVIAFAELDKHGKARWHCLCDCGKAHVSTTNAMRSGDARSCGCYHSEQMRRIRSTTEERFWAKVCKSEDDGCWLWTASTNPQGYGCFRNSQDGSLESAHRASYRLAFGEIPEGLFVCHRCDVRLCVRPSHLFLGTPAENVADMIAKGRECRGDQHPLRRHPERIPRGAAVGTAKLSEADVLNIRQTYNVGGVSHAELGRRFGVNQSTITRIIRKKRWAHLG